MADLNFARQAQVATDLRRDPDMTCCPCCGGRTFDVTVERLSEFTLTACTDCEYHLWTVNGLPASVDEVVTRFRHEPKRRRRVAH